MAPVFILISLLINLVFATRHHHKLLRNPNDASSLLPALPSRLLQTVSFKGIDGCQCTKSLGYGAYGKVYRIRMVTLKRDQEAALKVFDTGKGDECDQMEFYTERNILRAIASMEKAFGIKLQIAHWRDDILGIECPKLMLEFIPGTDMEQILLTATLPFSSLIKFVLSMIKQIDNVLNWLHLFNIYHNDIKPANIMYDARKKIFFLVDFGLAVPLSLLDRWEFAGLNFWTTIGYLSPYHFDLLSKRGDKLIDDEQTRTKAAFAGKYSLGLTAIKIIGTKWKIHDAVYALYEMARTIVDVQQDFTSSEEMEYPSWTMEKIRLRLLPFWKVVRYEVLMHTEIQPIEVEHAAELKLLLAEWLALTPTYFHTFT